MESDSSSLVKWQNLNKYNVEFLHLNKPWLEVLEKTLIIWKLQTNKPNQ